MSSIHTYIGCVSLDSLFSRSCIHTLIAFILAIKVCFLICPTMITLITMILPAEVSSNAEHDLCGEQQHHHLPRPRRHHVQPHQHQQGENGNFLVFTKSPSIFTKSPTLFTKSLPIRRKEGWGLFSTLTANFNFLTLPIEYIWIYLNISGYI